MSELDLKYLRELAGQATPTTKDADLCRYEHGGGRLVVFEGERRLIADFYDEPNREFYAALNPQTAIALLDAVERLTKERDALLADVGQQVRMRQYAEAARDEARSAVEALDGAANSVLFHWFDCEHGECGHLNESLEKLQKVCPKRQKYLATVDGDRAASWSSPAKERRA